MLSIFTLASPNATSAAAAELERLPYGVPRRRIAEFRGRDRGSLFSKGRGHGRGTAKRSLLDLGPAFPAGRAPANERVCYPLPPADARAKQGQVLEGTSFGVALSAIASRVDVVRVLELGTWYGGGSTVNLGRGVRESARATLAASLGASAPADNCIDKSYSERCCHSLVVTVEVFEPAWEHARRYLRDLPVWCVQGSTVAAEEMLQSREIPPRLRDAHFRLYYQRDLALMRKSVPQLHRLCSRYHFDLVLIDGNEYTGWAEFLRVRKECQPTYLALHDTQTLKTHRIEEYLSSHTDEYSLFLRKHATHTMRPACELVGCREEGSFLPNSAGAEWCKTARRADALVISVCLVPYLHKPLSLTPLPQPGRMVHLQACRSAACRPRPCPQGAAANGGGGE
jgi:hypothetical protein